MYSKAQFGKELKEKLENEPFDIDKIADWAFEVQDNYLLEFSPELSSIINGICVMSMGPEFELSKEELELLADELIKSK